MKTRARRLLLGGLARLVVYVVLALALAAGALTYFGLPGFAERRLLAELERFGLTIRTRGIHLEWPWSLVARQVRVYPGPAGGDVIAEARSVQLRFGRDTAGRRWRLLGADAQGVTLRPAGATATREPGWAAGRPVLEVTSAELEFDADGLRIPQAEIRFGGLRWKANGYLATAEGPARVPGDWSARLAAATERAGRLARALEEFETGVPPTVHLRFNIYPNDPARNRITLSARGGAGRWRGLPVESWIARAELTGDDVELHRAEIHFARGRIFGAARYRGADQTLDARIEARLPCRDALCLPWPPGVTRAAERWLAGNGEIQVELETAGPVPLARWGERLRGRLEIGPGEIAGVPCERLAARFEREGSLWRLRDIEAVLGAQRRRGPARGELQADIETGRFTAQGETAFDPTILLPLLAEDQALAVGAAVFTGVPPRVRIELDGDWHRPADIHVRGRVEAEDFIYNGAAVRRAASDFEIRDRTVRLWNLVVERPEGRLEGRLTERLDAQEAEFETVSTLHPHAVGRLGGPFMHRLAQQFRFEGPIRIAGGGLATYGDRHEHHFDLAVEGERMGLRWLLADRVAFRVEARGHRIALRDIQGEWHGGAISGDFELTLTPGREPLLYQTQLRLDGVELAGIVRDLGDTDASAYSGRVFADVSLEGALGEGQGRATQGRIRLAVRDGQLMRIPLFGGLSRGLSRLFPGWGFAAQTEFSGDFTVSGGRIQTQDARLLGSTISLQARGHYDIEEGLRLVAQVKLLRAGAVASILRLVTWPITRLMEFDVRGPIEAPEWKPRNLPQELFRLFD